MAKEKGFFEDLGLEVDIKEAYYNQNTTEVILNNKDSFGISDSILIQKKMIGKDIKILGAVFQHTPFVFLSLKEANINTPADFKNKKIMLDLSSSDNSLVKILVKKYGIEEKDITYLPTSNDINDLIDKKVDIYSAYITNELNTLKEKGIEYNIIQPKDYGLKFYGDIVFTSEENFKNNPTGVKNFYKAVIQGWEYAFNNIYETINVIKSKYNTQNFSYEKLEHEAKNLKKLSEIEEGNLGKIELERINHILSTYYLSETNFNLNIVNKLDPFAIAKSNNINLTTIELDYLKQKKQISYCNRNIFLPYSFLERGEYKGMTIDYIKEIEKKLNIEFKPIITNNWEECLNFIKEGKVDFATLILTKPNSYKFLEVSDPYIKGYLVLATKLNEPFLLNMENINDKKIAISKSSKNIMKFLKIKYPNMNLKEVDSWEEGLKFVSQGKVYGFIGPSDSVAYKIQDNYPYELKIMNRLDNTVHTGSLGVKKENNILLSILNKSINQIDETKIREIRNSWVSVKQESDINYPLLWKFIAGFSLLLLAFIYKQYSLKRRNLKLEHLVNMEVQKNREKDKMLFQQTKLAAMGEMLNNIAHQWRQPLSSINSSVAVIDARLSKKQIKDNDLEKNLADIESQTKYMSETIESFRSFFNPLKDKEDFLLSKAVTSVLRIVEHDYEKKGIRIKVFVQKDISVNGYLGEYIQTVISILNNAKDAFFINKIKNPEIQIYLDEMLVIDDNAGGIKEEIIDRVFEPYFTTKHKDKGTGTGLYIAKMIIEHSMDGRLTIENIKNGCRLKIII